MVRIPPSPPTRTNANSPRWFFVGEAFAFVFIKCRRCTNTAPSIIDVPEMVFIAVDGKGNPNTGAEYSAAMVSGSKAADGGIRDADFICYPKCTTCKKAKALLDESSAVYDTCDIKVDNPSYDGGCWRYKQDRKSPSLLQMRQSSLQEVMRCDVPFYICVTLLLILQEHNQMLSRFFAIFFQKQYFVDLQ